MNLAQRLQLLANPRAEDRWELLYDDLENLPSLTDSEVAQVLQTLKNQPKCENSLVRLFCLDLLVANLIAPSRFLEELRLVIETGNNAERDTALQVIRKTSVDLPAIIQTLERVDSRQLSFFSRWELRRLIKKKQVDAVKSNSQ